MKRASLNHVFRLVWSRHQQRMVPVCENRRRTGKQNRNRAATLILVTLSALPTLASGAGVKVANGSGGTRVHQAPNGVTVVDIDRANAKGLSHNKFTDYNVDPSGLVLNNGNMAQVTWKSQLAGKIYGNANLDQSAKVILNEVVSTNPSQLAGFTEVVGGRADVVLANPYGITCSGCGFINTGRVTLSTGQPDIRDGELQGFDVRQGQVLINSAGLNASDQDYFDIVARSVKLESTINARNLNITAGAGHWDYQTRETSALSGNGDIDFAFDSTALGGMYANAITIHATEAGVGVRMLGDAAATTADFILDASGRIEIGADISAQKNLALNTSATDADALHLDEAHLTANQDLSLNAAGGATFNGGALVAGDTLSADLGRLVDQAGADGDDNNHRFGTNGTTLNIAGNANLNGTAWGSDGDQQWQVASLTVGAAGAQLYADALHLTSSGDLNLGQAQVIADSGLTLHADGTLTSTSGDDQLIASRTGDVAITAGNLDNQGQIAATEGDIDVRSDGSVDNSGTLQAGADLRIGGASGSSSQTLTNEGSIESGANLNLDADTISNTDGAQILAGSGSSVSADTINNQGVLVASGDDTAASIKANTLTNSTNATLQAGGALGLTLGSRLDNQGQLLADGDLTISGDAYQLDSNGVIQSAGTLCITGSSDCDATSGADSDVDLTINDEGKLIGKNLVLHGDSLTLNNRAQLSTSNNLHADLNSLTMAASTTAIIGAMEGGDTRISVGSAVTNRGAIHSGTDLALTANSLNNTSTAGISANNTLTLTTTDGDLINAGALYSGSAMTLTATDDDIVNRDGATIDSNGGITTESTNFTNNGSILAADDIGITVQDDFVNETLVNGQSIRKTLGNATNARGESYRRIANEGGADDGMHAWLFEDTISRTESLVGISTDGLKNKDKAQIISTGSNGTLTINYGSSGLNRVAVLSATNVNLIGGDGSSFTNESLSLYRYDYTRRWISIVDQKDGPDWMMFWARTSPGAGCNGCFDGDDGIDDDGYSHENWDPGTGWVSTTPVSNSNGIDGESPPATPTQVYNLATDGAVRDNTVTVAEFGSGIFATTLIGTGGDFDNSGSPHPDGAPKSGNVKETTGPNGATPVNPGDYSGTNLPPIHLPTNPNGHFVSSPDPSAGYLIETNPLFTSGEQLGSDYLVDQLGLDTDQIGLRLGDAAYESYLIRQQLISQTGSNLLDGYAGEQNMVKGLYDSANQQASSLGLTWGEPLSASQIDALGQDMVWMVEQQVDGRSVLAPVVYLSKTTRDALIGGAVVAADNTLMDVNSLTNEGGTLSGSENLSIRSQQDITNTSGTLKGGNVYLESTEGSIVNQTLVEGAGDDITYKTTIGKTAGIQSDNELLMSADKDITNLGANVSADGTAVLKAGGDITFDTIEDKTTETSYRGDSSHSVTTTHTTNKHIGSQLNVGGDLGMDSGGDTTIGGSDVNVDGKLVAKTGGSFKVEARQDQDITHSVEKKEGAGVGGGIYGRETTTTDDFIGTNKGSNVNVGGTAYVKSEKDITLVGSNMNVEGAAKLDAKNDIKVLDGLDERHTHTHTETQTYLSVDSQGDSNANAGAGAQAGNLSASANASASSNASNSSSLNLYKKTVTDTREDQTTSVASQLNVGGDLSLDAGNDITVRGSDVTGKTITGSAENVNILAGRNTHTKTSTTKTTAVGVFVDSKAGADAKAGAGANANLKTIGASAEAGANASAEATATLGARISSSTDTESDLTHRGSSLTATGGDVTINARKDATFQGSEVNATNDINVNAKNIRDLAAEDRHTESHQSTTQTAGLYVSGKASASASTEAKADPRSASVSAGASAEAKASGSAGIRYGREESSSDSGSTHNQVSSFNAGGSVNRHAEDTIVDQGTQITAGGDINQTATTIKDQAVHDQTWSHTSETSHEARLGVYAEGGVKGSADASAKMGPNGPTTSSGTSTGIEKSAGAQASYDYSQQNQSESSSTAVTSRYQAGGNINSTSSGKTELEGTQMQAGGNIALGASELTYSAAHDTTSTSSSSKTAHGGAKVNVVEKSATVDGSYGQENGTKDTSTAVTGGLQAGGNITINTTGDTTLEGTSVSAGKGIDIHSEKGDVNLKAAESTSHSEGDGFNAGVSVTAKKQQPGVSVNGGYKESQESSAQRTGVTLKSGDGDINISSGRNTTLEGANIDSGSHDTNIKAGGTVSLKEAVNESSSSHGGFDAKVDVSKKKQSAGGNIDVGVANEKQGTATSINSGRVTISGGTVVNQEAKITGDTTISGKVENQKLTSKKAGLDVQLGGEVSRTKPEPPAPPAEGQEPH